MFFDGAQTRAARAVAAQRVKSAPMVKVGDGASPMAASSDPPGVGPILLSIDEISELIGRSKSSIYEDEKKGVFPKRLKLGSSSRSARMKCLSGSRNRPQSAAGASAGCGVGCR